MPAPSGDQRHFRLTADESGPEPHQRADFVLAPDQKWTKHPWLQCWAMTSSVAPIERRHHALVIETCEVKTEAHMTWSEVSRRRDSNPEPPDYRGCNPPHPAPTSDSVHGAVPARCLKPHGSTPFRVTNHVTPRRLRTELKIKPLPWVPSCHQSAVHSSAEPRQMGVLDLIRESGASVTTRTRRTPTSQRWRLSGAARSSATDAGGLRRGVVADGFRTAT